MTAWKSAVTSSALAIAAVTAAGCQPPPPAERQPTEQRPLASDACDQRPLGGYLVACLLPASDNRHDPQRQLVGQDGTRHDCYWQRKAQADKEPSIAASGQPQQYVFEIDNRCAKTVRVTLESTDGEFQWWCPTDSAQPPAGQHRPISCYVQYSPGPVDLRRSYTLKATAFSEATILPVEFDPQVRLERAGTRLAFTGLPGAVP